MNSLIKKIFFEKPNNSIGFSSLQVFNLSLASRFGIGNILGVAFAISVGGPGVIFWIWISAIISIFFTFIENTLAQYYKVQKYGLYVGGPMYYISLGLGLKKTAIFFSIIFLVLFVFTMNTIQSKVLFSIYNVSFVDDRNYFLLLVSFVLLLIFIGGIKRVFFIVNLILPILIIIYLLFIFYVLLKNLNILYFFIKIVFENALGKNTTTVGLIIIIKEGLKYGFLFNGAATGSTSVAGASANVKHPVNSAVIQITVIIVNSFIISSGTAYLIISSNFYPLMLSNMAPSGFLLIQSSIKEILGQELLYLSSIFFIISCFVSILSNFNYGYSAFIFIFKSKKYKYLYIFISLTPISLGNYIYNMGLLEILSVIVAFSLSAINIVSIYKLKYLVSKIFSDFLRQIKSKKEPVFYNKNIIPFNRTNSCWPFEKKKNKRKGSDLYFTNTNIT